MDQDLNKYFKFKNEIIVTKSKPFHLIEDLREKYLEVAENSKTLNDLSFQQDVKENTFSVLRKSVTGFDEQKFHELTSYV